MTVGNTGYNCNTRYSLQRSLKNNYKNMRNNEKVLYHINMKIVLDRY